VPLAKLSGCYSLYLREKKRLRVDRLETKKVFEIRKGLSFVYKQIYDAGFLKPTANCIQEKEVSSD